MKTLVISPPRRGFLGVHKRFIKCHMNDTMNLEEHKNHPNHIVFNGTCYRKIKWNFNTQTVWYERV